MTILFLFIIVFILFIVSLRKNKNNSILDKESTNTIKGIFILLIIFSHVLNYFPYEGNSFVQNGLHLIVGGLGQLIVTMFFFVSGYGLSLSIIKKGDSYSKSIIINRFFRIIAYSFFSLIPFLIYGLTMQKQISAQDFFLATIGLKSIGNASWFLFAILFCYFTTWFVYSFGCKNTLISNIVIGLIILLYAVIGCFVAKDSQYQFDTVLAFPIGLLFATYRNKFISFFNKRNAIIISISSFVLVVGFRIIMQTSVENPYSHVFLMLVCNFSLCLFFTSLSRIFVFKSSILGFFGENSFSMFIMHLLAIRLFVDYIHLNNAEVNYVLASVGAITIGLPFKYLYELIDRFIINPVLMKTSHFL